MITLRPSKVKIKKNFSLSSSTRDPKWIDPGVVNDLSKYGYVYEGNQIKNKQNKVESSHFFYINDKNVNLEERDSLLERLKTKGFNVKASDDGLALIQKFKNNTNKSLSAASKSKEASTKEIGSFYNRNKKILNYLFVLLKKKKKSEEDKNTIKEVFKKLRLIEKKFKKEFKVKNSIVDFLINQRSLKVGKLEASFTSLSAAQSAIPKIASLEKALYKLGYYYDGNDYDMQTPEVNHYFYIENDAETKLDKKKLKEIIDKIKEKGYPVDADLRKKNVPIIISADDEGNPFIRASVMHNTRDNKSKSFKFVFPEDKELEKLIYESGLRYTGCSLLGKKCLHYFQKSNTHKVDMRKVNSIVTELVSAGFKAKLHKGKNPILTVSK